MKKLNKNGFMLIELLAVITIMGILILVAIPTISRTIENSRKDTFIDTAKQYVSGAKNMWVADDLVCSVDGSTYAPSAVPAGAYYIPVDTANSDNLPVLLEQGGKSSWGKRDVKGYILVYIDEDDEGQRKISYYPVLVDGVHGVNVSDTSLTAFDKIVRGDLKMSGAGYDTLDTENVQFEVDEDMVKASVCSTAAHIASGAGGSTAEWEIVSGDLNTIGSIVSIGDEQFYVFGQEDGNVKLLSMYNLYVGNSADLDYNVTPLASPTGKQSELARGLIDGADEWYGTTAFSSSTQKGITYSDYRRSIVEGYVNNYKTILEEDYGVDVVEARLITIDELTDSETFACVEYDMCSSKYSWIYSTSYWSGSPDGHYSVWCVFSQNLIHANNYRYDSGFGVRPVIEVPTSEF